MSVIYQAHDCENAGAFFDGDGTYGSIVRCNECGRYWRRTRALYIDGLHLTWRRVRWWNIRARRIIQNVSTSPSAE